MIERLVTTQETPKRPSQEKRHQLIEVLKKKVAFTNRLFRAMSSLDAHDQMLTVHVEEIWDEALHTFDEAVIQNVPQLIEIDRTIAIYTAKELEISCSMSEEAWERCQMQEEVPLELVEARDTIERLGEEREGLLRDSSEYLDFIGRIRWVVDRLLQKHALLKEVSEDPHDVCRFFAEQLPQYKEIDATQIIEIVRGPFSMSIVFSPEEYRRLFGEESTGIHFRTTPINVIKMTDHLSMRAAIHHEDIHNITDDAIATYDPIFFFKKRLERYLSSKEAWALGRIGHEQGYLDQLHGEILAAFEAAEARGFSVPARNFHTRFEKTAFSFDTAGHQILELIQAIRDEGRAQKDDALTVVLNQLVRNIEHGFKRIVRNMETYLCAAEQYGGVVRDEVEILFYLLRPTQYAHIASYLKENYGEKELREAEILQDFSRYATVDQLREGMYLLQRSPNWLSKEVKKRIVDRTKALNGEMLGEVPSFGITSLDHKRECVDLLKELGVLCGEEVVFSDLAQHMEYAFMDHVLRQGIENEYVDLPSFYATLTDAEKEELYSTFEVYTDYMPEDLGLDDLQQVKQRPLWRVLASLGFTQRFEATLSNER